MSQALSWVARKKTPPKVLITRIFNYGTWREWKAMKRKFNRAQIADAVKHPLPGMWNQRAKNLAEILYGVRMPKRALISYHV